MSQEDNGHHKIIEISQQRLAILEEQKAAFGLYVPAHIEREIRELRGVIQQAQRERVQQIFQSKHLELQPPPLAQGLILLVSPLRSGTVLSSLNTYQAIDYHRGVVRRCWLIATTDEQGSQRTAAALTQHFADYRITCTIHLVTNGADAFETLTVVRTIYESLPQEADIDPQQVVADITGGTKAMTAGMVLACGTSWPMQYMLYREQGRTSLPVLLHMSSAEETRS